VYRPIELLGLQLLQLPAQAVEVLRVELQQVGHYFGAQRVQRGQQGFALDASQPRLETVVRGGRRRRRDRLRLLALAILGAP
jgi:hypothetical protein